MLIAASTYLNSAPLVYSFIHGDKTADLKSNNNSNYEFVGDAAPSRCAQMLESGQCDIALIPVIEYQRIADLRIIPGIAVASRYQVRSVLLASRVPLNQVRRVAMDTSSRTSQSLAKILFQKKYGNTPEYHSIKPDPESDCMNMLKDHDAALVIGDPAMKLQASAPVHDVYTYDLAEEWRAMTGLPFVFAVWAIRNDAINKYGDPTSIFTSAKNEGISKINIIASQYSATLGFPVDDLINYLCHNVNYDLDKENLEGLHHYFELAYECGLINEIKPLDIIKVSE